MSVFRFIIGGLLVAALAGTTFTRAIGEAAESAPAPAASLTVPILMYHRVQDLPGEDAATLRQSVTPAEFDAQLQFLADHHYTPITLSQLASALDHAAPLPPNPVALTFDDGWACAYQTVLPALESRGMHATFFIYPAAHDDTHHGRFMSWDQIRDLRARGMAIGSHTLTHPHLTNLPPDLARQEIEASRTILQQRLGTPIDLFAYPYGEFTPEHEAMARDAGFRLAVGVTPGIRHDPSARLHLSRIPVVFGETLIQFAATLKGEDVPGITSPLRKPATTPPLGDPPIPGG